MKVSSTTKVIAVVMGLVLLAAGGYLLTITTLDGLSHTELIIREAEAQGTPLDVDPERVRGEMPVLARALDEASQTGSASITKEKDAKRAMVYLGGLAVEQTGRGFQSNPTNGTLAWEGKILIVGLFVA